MSAPKDFQCPKCGEWLNRNWLAQHVCRTPEQRAWNYINAMGRAIQGSGGDDLTYKVCVVLVNDYALSETVAWALLQDWNKTCEPPWQEKPLKEKLRSAMRGEHKHPKGWKLTFNKAPCTNGTGQRDNTGGARQEPIRENVSQIRQPDRRGFGPGNLAQLKRLAALRGIGREGLEWAQERGLLIFGHWHGNECFGVTDSSERICELRRLDGNPFPAFGEISERKSHALAGSKKAWPVGILEAKEFPCIALFEGIPDLLSGHFWILWEQASHYRKRDVRCAPVAMLSAMPAISEDALPHFKDKHVRIFPHADGGEGVKGGAKWHKQITGAGAKCCDVFDMTRLKVKDLNEFLGVDAEVYKHFPQLFKIMPDNL